METNLRIIKLVQRRPVLYTKCNDFRARANQWKEIADILKIDVSFAKSRWHLLRAKFIQEYSSALKGKHSTFKYLDEMSFLVNHINLDAFEMYSNENDQYRTQPEFNITKKDLEEASDNDSTNEFIELELDEENRHDLSQISYGDTEETSQNEYIDSIYIDDFSNAAQPEEEEEMPPNNKFKERDDAFLEAKPSDKGNIEKFLKKEVSKHSIGDKYDIETKTDVQDLEEKPCKIDISCLTETSEEIPPPIPEKQISNANKIENHRCEDTIFGELVIATLREMQSDKKKAVKREIMNILFT